ncbi:hypothetical protein [Enhygromyxa salina]|uniref:Uncharacterized protein n=1 Tax=Enhygromyxa salina TaxID=215803 RepID=A0A2S9YVV2_9BACT|nr:hypothetical protein [Enhygromyxa salina]PRQ09241.1 hypothetical protein ENSA7_12310 [Enhygromyxa salina]
MSEIPDEYLWTGEGPPSADVVALEAELGRLSWRPRALKLHADSAAADPAHAAARVVAIEAPRRSSRRSATWIAGVVAAAAVLMVAVWLRPPTAPSAAPDPVDPTSRPISPDLKDPFARQALDQQGGLTTPITDPPQQPPAAGREVSPDLEDPFAGSSSTPNQRVPPDRRNRERRVSPDLKDPFKSGDQPRDPPKSRPSHEPPQAKKQVSPDLKDPFANN